ncbi:MAG: translation elongation factor-like protein [Candidatus Firestonebacteria bacterium]
MEEKEIGRITHYFKNIGVSAIEITKDGLSVGDEIKIKGTTTDFIQKVEAMQIEHNIIQSAKKGDVIGIKVKDRVRPHDKVYKIIQN